MLLGKAIKKLIKNINNLNLKVLNLIVKTVNQTIFFCNKGK